MLQDGGNSTTDLEHAGSYRLRKAMEALEASPLEAAPPIAPAVHIENHSVPQHYQQPGKRLQYRHYIMQQLYSGSWRYSSSMSQAYPSLHSFLLLAIASVYQVMHVVCNAKALIALEFIMCWICRLRNQHHLVIFPIALSLYMYHYGASGHVWQLGSHLRICYSKPWTKRFATDMAAKLPPPNFEVSKLVAIDAVDNDFILMRLGLQRAGVTHKCIHMVQHVGYFADVKELNGMTANDFADGILHKPASWTALRL